MPKEKNEAGKAISSAKGIVNEDRIENIRAVRKRAQERIKQVDTTSPENEDYLDSMTQKVYTSDKDK
jgi:ribosome recycling factor